MKAALREYWPSIFFVLIFTSLYLLLNTCYGAFIEHYSPDSDPITHAVARHVAMLVSVFHNDVVVSPLPGSNSIPLELSGQYVVNVFEGCNGVNVMIVYASFLLSFSRFTKGTFAFLVGGLTILHLMNLFRVVSLFEVALRFPDQLYLFHKYVFTAFIYGVVFVIWFLWINHVRSLTKRTG